MAIYYKDIIATLEFEGEENLQLENQFDKDTPTSLSKIRLTIIVRDIKQGRSGKDSPHRNNPSIKIKDRYDGGARHSPNGDPIYFSSNNEPDFRYDGKQRLNSTEEKYLQNFINHNYVNLMNYWFAPEKCETPEMAKELQHEIQRRLQFNINHEDYSKGEYIEQDAKVEISPKVQRRLKVSSRTI